MKNIIWILLINLLFLAGCSKEEVDFNNPDAKTFVKQIKTGTYHTKSPNGFVEVPSFAKKDIPELIKYVKDVSSIPSFPSNPVSSYGPYANYRLGECIMWTIEYIRLGRYASLGCKLVHKGTNEHMQYAFLSNDEIKSVANLYISWWNRVINQPMCILEDPFTQDPLQGSNFKWN